MRLSTDFLQRIPQRLVLDISKLNSRKHILQQGIESFRVCVRQLRQSVDSQRLHNKLRFSAVVDFPCCGKKCQ